jgi:Na+/H+ antiporter NhaD/arsenite permease-like protein
MPVPAPVGLVCVASMALYIGNPTNVVVSQAYSIGFLEYSAWMLIPTVICSLLAYITMRILFRNAKYIPKTIMSPDADPQSVLVDPFGAVFGVVLLGCCLGTLIGTSFAGIEVWQITLPFSVVMFVRDVVQDMGGGKLLLRWVKSRRQRALPPTNETVDPILSSHSIGSQTTDVIPLEPVTTQPQTPPALSTSVSVASSRSLARTHAPSIRSVNSNKPERSIRLRDRLPTLYAIATRMPWKILPFALGMFILVEGLSDLGWTAIFATALARITPTYYAAVFSVTFISLMACQLLNNLPMTILFTRIMQHPNFYQAANVTPQVLKGCIFSLVVGSNLGACFTLVGSLAGIM